MARSNSDLSPFFKIGVTLTKLFAAGQQLSDLREPERQTVLKQAVEAMLQDINDMEFYCSEYASKEQPHTEGLL